MRAVSAASNRGALPAVVSSIRPAVSGTALPSVGPHSPLSERKSNNPSNRTGRTRGCPMSTRPDRTPAGIEGSSLPGPYPVGRYAAQLREWLRGRARVQLFGEVWNLRIPPRGAKVYFELRDAAGALPC